MKSNVFTILDKITTKLCQLGKVQVGAICYGYGPKVDQDLVDELTIKQDILKREANKILRKQKRCFSDEELSKLLSKIDKKLVNCGNTCNLLFVDDSLYNSWVTQNPFCRRYEDWEKCLNVILPEYGFNPKLEIYNSTEFKLDVEANNITPEILLELSKFEVIGDYSLALERAVLKSEFLVNLERDEIKNQLLLIFEREELHGVLDFKMVMEEVQNNKLSLSLIDKIYESNCELSLDLKSITTPNNNRYEICKLIR